jgi:hypothetical protein
METYPLPSWVEAPSDRKMLFAKTPFLPLPEWVGMSLLLGVAGVTIFLARTYALSPGILLALIIFHYGIVALTAFKEKTPTPFSHFSHPVMGVVILSMLLVGLAFFVTLLLEGLSSTSLERAQIAVSYTYFMLLWAVSSSITTGGIYFAVSVIVLWFPYYVQIARYTDPPFILYLLLIGIAFMSLGLWLTQLNFLYTAIFEREDFGPQSKRFKYWGWIIGILSSLLCIVLILLEKHILDYFLTLIAPEVFPKKGTDVWGVDPDFIL